MSEQIKTAFVSFGRGMVTFVRPWRPTWHQPKKTDSPRGIGIYFGRVGSRLNRAAARYAEAHPEIPADAH